MIQGNKGIVLLLLVINRTRIRVTERATEGREGAALSMGGGGYNRQGHIELLCSSKCARGEPH